MFLSRLYGGKQKVKKILAAFHLKTNRIIELNKFNSPKSFAMTVSHKETAT